VDTAEIARIRPRPSWVTSTGHQFSLAQGVLIPSPGLLRSHENDAGDHKIVAEIGWVDPAAVLFCLRATWGQHGVTLPHLYRSGNGKISVQNSGAKSLSSNS
jgi:hypothetical protein